MIVKMRRVRAITFMLLMVGVFGGILLTSSSSQAAQLSRYMSINSGVKYSGTKSLTLTSSNTVGTLQYFSVNNSIFTSGDLYYLSFKISGASDFKQLAVQSNLNNWDWNSAQKVWNEDGITDGTVVAGVVETTQSGTNLAFRIRLMSLIGNNPGSSINITLSDLVVLKVTDEDNNDALLE